MLIKKPPIIVILGHIDHGKTTLLDYIRKSNVALKEAGGITQKIGAYEIEFDKEKITFIDTPGHSAFNNLRQRGVQVADIGILIIAADEGVKDQTKESLEYLKSAKIPFIVALTKIDKKEADTQRVVSQLVELDIIPEKWGGQVPLIEVSAKTGEGVNDLLETIILLRDIYDLKVETDIPGRGFILESIKDPKRGILASAIVSGGVINYGNFLVTPSACCKIKIFEDDFGRSIKQALPSKPFLVGNFDNFPLVGEEFEIADESEIQQVQQKLRDKEKAFLNQFIFKNKEITNSNSENVFNLILKADNFGSLEALVTIFNNLAQEQKINLRLIKADVGLINFDDLKLAKDTGSILISFNLKNQKQILDEIRTLNLKFFDSNLIYELEEKFLELLNTKEEKIIKGELEVLAVFSQTKNKKTIGGRVINGKIRINQRILIIRDNQEIGQGKIISLEKDKVPSEEVKEGDLCGLIIETTKDIYEKDIVRVK
jgi:translation initiation factor IF-2